MKVKQCHYIMLRTNQIPVYGFLPHRLV
jgi:hypothetical protein